MKSDFGYSIKHLLFAAVVYMFAFQLTYAAGPLSRKTLGSDSSYNVGIFPPSAVVGRGDEFGDLMGNLAFDFDEFGYLTISLEFGILDLRDGGEYVEFFDQNGDIDKIVGFTLLSADSGISNLDQGDLSFTANSVRVVVGGTKWMGENSKVAMRGEFATINSDPDPDPDPDPEPTVD
jgi:hypothetical protein